jgi:hypothetical protein
MIISSLQSKEQLPKNCLLQLYNIDTLDSSLLA